MGDITRSVSILGKQLCLVYSCLVGGHAHNRKIDLVWHVSGNKEDTIRSVN